MQNPIDDTAVLWSANANDRLDRPLLLLLHGYGSHEGDLFGLAPYLSLSPVIASLRAPIEMGQGNAWFPLSDGPSGLVGVADEVADAVTAVLAWIDALDPAPSSIGLLGFSQGGAMAIELMRARPDAFEFAVVLAGFVADTPPQNDARLAEVAPPVFWGRGTADAVISRAHVDRTQAWLPAHSTLTERIYEGVGHALSEDELRDVVAFIGQQYR